MSPVARIALAARPSRLAGVRPGVRRLIAAGPVGAIRMCLGGLWMLDGALQFQHFMYTRSFTQSLLNGASGQPAWLAESLRWAVHLAQPHLVVFNTLFALVQVAIGAGLMLRRTAKPAIAASIAWSVIVWWIGEGFGMLFTSTASPLTGAPGAVVLYAVIALAVWPNGRPGGLLGVRGVRAVWALLWLAMAWLWLLPANTGTDAVSTAIGAAPSGAHWLSSVQSSAARVVSGDGLAVALLLAVLSASIGVAVASNWRPRTFLAIAVALNLAYWVIGQGLGGIFTGSATDPNAGPLFVLLAAVLCTLVPVSERATVPARAAAWIGLASVVFVGAMLAAGAVPVLAASAVPSLRERQALFWSGPEVSSERVPDPSLCGSAGACIDYPVRVLSTHAGVLRAGLQSADESNNWGLELIDPSGHAVASGTTYELDGLGQNFNVEVWAHHPAPGTWTIRIVPENVQNGTFQMRVALDPKVSWPSTNPELVHGKLRRGVYNVPPDLAADAPWALTFTQPTPMLAIETGNPLAAAGVHHASASVGGQSIYDCLPEETLQQNAHRCLRFSSGFSDVGPGIFEVYGDSGNSPVAPNGGPLYQDIYRSNGTHWSRKAGMFMFHDIHAHYHVMGIANFEIFHVLAHHKLVGAGTVLKEGFCLGNVKIFNWDSFAQDEIDPNSQDNCEPSPQSDGTWRFYQGIEPGWEDVYVWQTSGQYVDFANDPDGTYLLRMVVNPDNYLLESDSGHDHNDVAYTYFTVTGDNIRIVQRGRGMSPWDPHRQVLDPVFGEG